MKFNILQPYKKMAPMPTFYSILSTISSIFFIFHCVPSVASRPTTRRRLHASMWWWIDDWFFLHQIVLYFQQLDTLSIGFVFHGEW